MAAEWIDSFQGDLSPWWFWQLCFCSVWGRCPAERGEQTQRYAQLSAQLSARPCSLDWSCFHTTLRCTESIHFLWSQVIGLVWSFFNYGHFWAFGQIEIENTVFISPLDLVCLLITVQVLTQYMIKGEFSLFFFWSYFLKLISMYCVL